MTTAEVASLAEGWVRYQLAEDDSAQQAEYWDFVSAVLDIRSGDDPELLWQIIVAIHSRDRSDAVWCVLAAGPLEDLLANHGPAFIEVVEEQALNDPAFAKLLCGVYRRNMTDDVWHRVTMICRRSDAAASAQL